MTSSHGANWPLRQATLDDVPELEEMIPLSVRALQAPYYSSEQMDGAVGSVFGVDRQLIRDGTYFIAEEGGRIVGCGGWSRRRSLHGSDRGRVGEDLPLDPEVDAARIRAFFVHPQWARRGIGRSILERCEAELQRFGFRRAEIVATLAGEPLYGAYGYRIDERIDLPLENGLVIEAVRMSKDF
jgi:GNAT superfamily N-acetyltransferase